MENTQNPTMIFIGNWLIPFTGICKAVAYTDTYSTGFFRKKNEYKYCIEVKYLSGRYEKILYLDKDTRDDDFSEFCDKLVKAGLVFDETFEEEDEEPTQECQENEEGKTPERDSVGVQS